MNKSEQLEEVQEITRMIRGVASIISAMQYEATGFWDADGEARYEILEEVLLSAVQKTCGRGIPLNVVLIRKNNPVMWNECSD